LSAFQWTDLDSKAVNTARVLAADAVEKVGNGHPGTAISLAPVAYLLFNKVMRHDPSDDRWIGRDRFILSVGHSSLTIYNQLYLHGYGLELDDLKALRTWGSATPGHPEYGHTKGVEITTGPLGQGLASATGFAYAARFERGLYDPAAPAGTSPFDHFVYVIAGDGDMQEGVTAEAASLAGHQKLGNLVVIYDSNQISIEDDTNIAFTEDLSARYESYGWHTQTVDWKKTGNYVEDIEELYNAIEKAKSVTDKPSLITLRTIIGWPSPKKQNSGKIHGSALGAEELAGLKTVLGFDPEQTFEVAPEVIAHTRDTARFDRERSVWEASFDAWASENADKKALLERVVSGATPDGLEAALPVFENGSSISTRVASGKVINAIASVMPELWGGSADLADSNMTTIAGAKSFVPAEWSTHEWTGDTYGRVLHFGIREHAMGSILNGIVLHGNTRAFGGTFLIFSDYMRPAVRLAALMGIPSIFVWTHDSVALGEDGPTHQPIEQLATLRAIPNLDMVRPADGNETAFAWKTVLERRQGPAGLALSRQNLPVYERGSADSTGTVYAGAENTAKGAYTLLEAANGKPAEVILIATGSEVEIAVNARLQLEAAGIATRVVSAPCLEWFDEQPAAYREQVLPASVKAKVSVEAGLSLGWNKYVGPFGKSVSIEHFGASADAKTLYREFGMTAEAVVAAARESIAN
jgi:transketolase